MIPVPPSLDAFKRLIAQQSLKPLYSGDRIRVQRSPITTIRGKEFVVIEQTEDGTLTCRSISGSAVFKLFSYQVRLVHRPILNTVRTLFAVFAV
ncbi:MAG: hypothetical protein ABI599_11520 [Flavobacteriales bacterium]